MYRDIALLALYLDGPFTLMDRENVDSLHCLITVRVTRAGLKLANHVTSYAMVHHIKATLGQAK